MAVKIYRTTLLYEPRVCAVVNYATQLHLNCYGQLESREKSLPSTQLFDTNFFSHELRNNEAESPLNDADFVRLSTSLSLSSVDAVATVHSVTT